MYTAFYGLREKPFSLTPDPRFLFLAESHREALAHLLYGLEQGEGFIVVSGEVGTGKTTICRTLLERLGAETELAFLFNPSGSADEMLESVNEEFGLPASGLSRRELLSALNRFLLEKSRESKRVVLIIDEAQNLSTTTLEQVRLLSNLETTSSKLIQIILLGQPELAAKLDSDELRQLRQRIGVRWLLSPLSAAETAKYVRHRLRIAAGADRAALFSDAALTEVHRRTGGVPRLVNVLCDRALLAGYAAEVAQVGVPQVKQAAREIRDLQGETFGAPAVRRRRRAVWWGAPLGAALAALAVGGGVWIGRSDAGRSLRSWLGVEARPPVSAPPTGARAARGAADVAEPAGSLPPVSARAPLEAEMTPWSPQMGVSGSEGPLSSASGVAATGASRNDAEPETLPPLRHDAGAPPDSVRHDALDDARKSARHDLGASPPGPLRQEASVAPLAAEAARPGTTDGDFLAHLLAEVSAQTSRDLAVTEILHAWGRPDRVGPGGSEALALARLRDAGLALHTVFAPDLEELARLDRPALIEVRDGDGEIHWLALIELRPSVAFVGGVVDRGPIGVAVQALGARFEGRAHVVWSPGVEMDGASMLHSGSEGHSVRWVQEALAELGYLGSAARPSTPGDTPAVYDTATRQGVVRFQRAQGLREDGITGPVTLMRLDDALGRNDRPHLRSGGAG